METESNLGRNHNLTTAEGTFPTGSAVQNIDHAERNYSAPNKRKTTIT